VSPHSHLHRKFLSTLTSLISYFSPCQKIPWTLELLDQITAINVSYLVIEELQNLDMLANGKTKNGNDFSNIFPICAWLIYGLMVFLFFWLYEGYIRIDISFQFDAVFALQ
jgi:hypothetical protein